MADDPKDKVPTSSIVMKAIDAKTFSELQAFTKDLESRPIERVLRDVADLVPPSESKAPTVSYLIAQQFRNALVALSRSALESVSDLTMLTDSATRLGLAVRRTPLQSGHEFGR